MLRMVYLTVLGHVDDNKYGNNSTKILKHIWQPLYHHPALPTTITARPILHKQLPAVLVPFVHPGNVFFPSLLLFPPLPSSSHQDQASTLGAVSMRHRYLITNILLLIIDLPAPALEASNRIVRLPVES